MNLQKLISSGAFALIYPRDKSQESANLLAEKVEGALGVASLQTEQGKTVYGVLVCKLKLKDLLNKVNQKM